MNQIEKVARAICSANGYDPDTNHEGSPIWVDWVDDAKASIAALTVQAETQWQGIESAPRDWTDVLVFSPEHSGFNCAGVFSAFYDTDHPGWFANGPGDSIPLTPTHWMPLPTPPAGGSDAE